MEEIFSTSSKIIDKQIDLDRTDSDRLKLVIEKDLDFYFDTTQISKWVNENKFARVGLQFPDELLNQSVKVCARLKRQCPESLFFILADTSYGSCCADVVAAQHYNADCLVHFGRSCLSPVEKLPVFYVFEKFPLDLDHIMLELDKLVTQESTRKIIVLYDIAYFYLYSQMVEKFSKNSNIYISKIKIPNSSNDESLDGKLLLGRIFPHDVKTSNYAFFYITSSCTKDTTILSPLMFYFNRNTFYTFDGATVEELSFGRTNRALMKRYYLIERARDARIFGILVGTMSVANYREAVRHVEAVLKKAGRRYYSFLIGKLNCAKLNNFMEVDMYVMVSCAQNCLVDSKELNKPVITVFELEMAFNCARVWGDEFVCDFRQLLPGSEHYMETQLSDKETDVSLITGETRFMSTDSTAQSDEATKSLVGRNEGLALMHVSAAGEFLNKRSWTGLEQNLGQTPVSKAIEGKKGIAATYDDETKT